MKHFVSQILDVSGSCSGQLKLFVSLVSVSQTLDVSGSCSGQLKLFVSLVSFSQILDVSGSCSGQRFASDYLHVWLCQ